MSILQRSKEGIHRRLRKLNQKILKQKMEKNVDLMSVLNDYLKKSQSTGCDMSDYFCLYSYVREHKPKEVLELGTGASTVVIAHALMENHKETGVQGRVTSMEDIPKYFEMARSLFPEKYKNYAEIILSESAIDFYAMFRGIHYKNIPTRQYNFVFIDGPDYKTSDGSITFDFDFINVVKNSDTPVVAFIDRRFTTCYVLEQIFGEKNFKFDYLNGLGIVGPVTKKDLRPIMSWMRKRFNLYPINDVFRVIKNIL